MITISPKLTSEEMKALRERADRRDGMQALAEKIGINRNTLRTTMHLGTCSKGTAELVRKYLKTVK